MDRLSVDEATRILGLTGGFDPDAVKRAYRQCARQHHPDRGGDPRTFQRVQAAYDLLRDRVDGNGPVRPGATTATASVVDRWWESATMWHDGVVDTSAVAWAVALPESGPFPLSRDRLALLLAEDHPVATVTAHSRAPGSRLHRAIRWLQPDLLAELSIAPAGERGVPGHDVHVRFSFRSMKARRIAAAATLPQGWTQRRGSSSTTVQRVLHPSPSRRGTAVRVADLVDEATAAAGWPLGDWYVVGR